jgi:hypothetical protein
VRTKGKAVHDATFADREGFGSGRVGFRACSSRGEALDSTHETPSPLTCREQAMAFLTSTGQYCALFDGGERHCQPCHHSRPPCINTMLAMGERPIRTCQSCDLRKPLRSMRLGNSTDHAAISHFGISYSAR